MPNLSSAGRKAFLGAVQVAIRKGALAVINLWNGTITTTQNSVAITYPDQADLDFGFDDTSLVVFPEGPWLEIADDASGVLLLDVTDSGSSLLEDPPGGKHYSTVDLDFSGFSDTLTAELQEPLNSGGDGVVYDDAVFPSAPTETVDVVLT